MERLVQIHHKFCQALKGELIGAGVLGMAAVPEAFGLPQLRGTQSLGASS